MTTAEQIKVLCVRMDISISELARRIGQSPQNFSAKLKRGTITDTELVKIADITAVQDSSNLKMPSCNSKALLIVIGHI